MAWIIRGDRAYRYRTTRQDGKVVCRYEAAIPAEDVAILRRMAEGRRAEREAGRAAWEAERARLDEAERTAMEADAAYSELATAALLATGHHRPQRGRWRRRRPMATNIEARPEAPPLETEADALLDRIERSAGEEKKALQKTGWDLLHLLLDCARNGDERALPALRVFLRRRPHFFPKLGIGDFAVKAMALSGSGSRDVLLRDMFIEEIGRVRDELAGPAPTALERLLAERVALAWFDANQRGITHVEVESAGISLEKAEFLCRQRSRATARFLAAARSLATVRRLALPVLHLHRVVPPPAEASATGDRLQVLAGDVS